MRPAPSCLAVLLSIATVLPAAIVAAAPPTDPYHLVMSRRVLSAGEDIQFRVEPSPPPGVVVHYSGGSPTSGFVSGRYRAPYVIPVGCPPATVTATLSGAGIKTSVTAQVE